MRLDVNLATRAYEDARHFYLRWGSAVAVAAVLTLALVFSAVMGWLSARRDRQTIHSLRAQIASRDQERAAAEAYLNRSENRSLRDRSQFLNGLIERKAFSWTQVFEDLEKVMPARLHVVSIRPELNEENQLQIKLVVAGESRDRALDLVRRMEQSPRFRQPGVTAENAEISGQGTGDKVEFNISALYVPAVAEGTR